MPKGARRTTPSPETLAGLDPGRLIALVLAETARNPAFKRLVSAALAARQGPEAVAAMVDRRLAALEGARGYVDWQKRRAFAADLDATVRIIATELRPLDAGAALERLRRFLDGADGVMARVDDASGAIEAVYGRAGEALVEAAAALPDEAAARFTLDLLPAFARDPFGPFAGLLGDLIARLPDTALAGLDAELAQLADAAGGRGGSEAAFRRDARRGQVARLRQALADRRGDVDAYVALEVARAPERPDRVALARRLLAAGRAAEALDWARRPAKVRAAARPGPLAELADLAAGDAERERLALEIAALDALGRGAEAQALRWGRFAQALDAPMLRDHLARLPDFEDDETLARALAHAEGFPDPHRALFFLAAWPDLPRAARLVHARLGEWRGDRYGALAPAADALAADHPAAATQLYRRLLDEILRAGHSGAYAHGARYLSALDGLAERVEPGAVAPDPAAYRTALRAAHGRKRAFWSLLGD